MTEHETKVVNVRDGAATELTLMVTAGNGDEHQPLESQGMKGEYVFVTILEPGVSYTSYDPHELEKRHPAIGGENPLFGFLTWLQNDHERFEELEDGKTYTAEEIEEYGER